MNEITRERIWRKLQVLPDEQLYEVLDYIEFIEHKYAPGRARRPDSIQRFAERLEDGLRMRSVAPKVISGTVGVIGTARRMFRSVADAGRDFMDDVTSPSANPARSGVTASAAGPCAVHASRRLGAGVRPEPGDVRSSGSDAATAPADGAT